MKIAILSRYQNTVNRGAETVVLELVARLSKNHNVDVLSGKDSDSFFKIINGNYDIVMPMNGRLQSLKASIGRIFGGYKLVIGGHSGIGKDDIFNIAVCKPDVFIALTDYMASWAKKWAWGSKVVKISDGVDLEKFKPEGEKLNFFIKGPIILSVGSLSWYKFHDRTINAVSLLKEGSLLIVGDGEERENLEGLGKEKLGDRFRIMKIGYEDMPKIYRTADVFTLPSWNREAFGVVYLEAMASGVPIVAPDDSSRREIIGNAGILTDVANPQKFSDAIKLVLGKKWGDIPRKQAEKFNWDKIAKEYENCFIELLK